jgi:hypothetical protein
MLLYVLLSMWLLCVCPQLKWNLPDETGGEVITLYQLKVKPLPLCFTDAPEPDSEVGPQDHSICCCQCTCHLPGQCLWSVVVDKGYLCHHLCLLAPWLVGAIRNRMSVKDTNCMLFTLVHARLTSKPADPWLPAAGFCDDLRGAG